MKLKVGVEQVKYCCLTLSSQLLDAIKILNLFCYCGSYWLSIKAFFKKFFLFLPNKRDF